MNQKPQDPKKTATQHGVQNSTTNPTSDGAGEGSATRTGVHYVEITAENTGQRIDNFLISVFKTIPRSLVYRLLRTGQVRVNKGRIKPSYKLSLGDNVRIPPVTVTAQQEVRVPKAAIEAVSNSIIEDGPDWIVINKPAGMAVHGGTGVTFGIIDAIHKLYNNESISLVHRLDKATSGVMVLAKHRRASVHFQKVMMNGEITKNYAALVCGVLAKPQTVTARLRKTHPTPNENQVIIDPSGGKDALSHFKCRVAGDRFSLVDVEIETGRTHQIRVHAASIGHPVLGDERYGIEKINNEPKLRKLKRMFLHAHEITFPDLSEESATTPSQALTFTVPFDTKWLDIVTY